MFIFGNPPDPRRLGCAQTLRYARLYPRQSRASLGGYYGGNPERPQKVANVFSKYFRLDPKRLVSLEKRTRGVSNYGTGPTESWGRLRLQDTAPPHHPTPTFLMNVNFLAEVYLSRIREHGNKVKKTKARTHKASMGHTVNFNDNKILYS